MLRIIAIAVAGFIAIAAALAQFTTSAASGSREATEQTAARVLGEMSAESVWRVRGSWHLFPQRFGYEVSLQPADDPMMVVNFALMGGEDCSEGSACRERARTALANAMRRRPEHARIVQSFADCGIPVFAIHRMRFLPSDQDRPARLEAWIDLELSLDEGEYRAKRGKLETCILDWQAARAADPGIHWRDAQPSILFNLLPPGEDAGHVLLNNYEVSDYGARYRLSHYTTDLRDGRLGEMRIGPATQEAFALLNEIGEALEHLIVGNKRLSDATIATSMGGLWVSRENPDILWAHYMLCLGDAVGQPCPGRQQLVRLRYDRSTGVASDLALVPEGYNPMKFSEDGLREAE